MAEQSTFSGSVKLSCLDRFLDELSNGIYERAIECHQAETEKAGARLTGAVRLRGIIADLKQRVRGGRSESEASPYAAASTRAA